MRTYSYQYETSPRKIKPEYENVSSRNKNVRKKSASQSSTAKNKKQENVKKTNKTKSVAKKPVKETNKNQDVKTKFSVFVKCVLLFLILFLNIYRNSLITQSFAKIQKLKTSITELQKENNQLEINIQNCLNTNNIEKEAKELLGMQKLTNKQIVYISLSKKDYVEPRTEEIIIEENENFFQKIKDYIVNMF